MSPFLDKADRKKTRLFKDVGRNLEKTLVYDSGFSPLGLLRNCMDYALNDASKIDGVFAALEAKFQVEGGRDVLARVQHVNDFRNTRVAHQEEPLTEAALAKNELLYWIEALRTLAELP